MISAIVPATSTVFAVFAGPKGEVIFSRVQCWAVTDIVTREGNQMVLAGRSVTGVALLNGQLAPCNGVNVLEFVGYDESTAVFCSDGFAHPVGEPWAEKCAARRKAIGEEQAKAKQSKIVLPGGAGVDPAWNAAKDLEALRSGGNPLD